MSDHYTQGLKIGRHVAQLVARVSAIADNVREYVKGIEDAAHARPTEGTTNDE